MEHMMPGHKEKMMMEKKDMMMDRKMTPEMETDGMFTRAARKKGMSEKQFAAHVTAHKDTYNSKMIAQAQKMMS